MRMHAAQFKAIIEVATLAPCRRPKLPLWLISGTFSVSFSLCHAACRAVAHTRSFYGMQAVTSERTPSNQHGESADALARTSSTQRPTPDS